MSKKTAEKQAVARKELTMRQWIWKEMKRNWVAYVMVAPYMLIFTIFTICPVLLSVIISFTNFNILEMPDFVFLSNYITLFFDDDIFLTACTNTFIFACIVGPASYLLSFLVAWFINELPPKIRAVVTLIFYAPSISGNAYLIWQTLFASDSYGWVNGKLLSWGMIDAPILWFENEKYVMGLCIIVALWTSLGTSFLSFIAGLQGIDSAQFEAAAVDGIKNRWQELWYVTLPNMYSQLLFGAVLSITGAFSFGGIVTTLAGHPSVNYVAYTISHHLNEYQNTRWEVGYASAISFVLFLMMIGSNMAITKLLSKVGR